MNDPELTQHDKDAIDRIRKHCNFVRQWDAAEAERIYERCRENLPWLNLPARPVTAKSAKHHSSP